MCSGVHQLHALHQDSASCLPLHHLHSEEGSNHARPFVGVFQKSIYNRTRQLLAINAHKMDPRTTRWLQERQGDAPTKGLAWFKAHRLAYHSTLGSRITRKKKKVDAFQHATMLDEVPRQSPGMDLQTSIHPTGSTFQNSASP